MSIHFLQARNLKFGNEALTDDIGDPKSLSAFLQNPMHGNLVDPLSDESDDNSTIASGVPKTLSQPVVTYPHYNNRTMTKPLSIKLEPCMVTDSCEERNENMDIATDALDNESSSLKIHVKIEPQT